jgi:hypothetical protein
MAEDMLLDQAKEVAVEQGAGTLEQYGDYTMRRNYGDRHLYGGGAVAKSAGKAVIKALPVYKAIDLLRDIFFPASRVCCDVRGCRPIERAQDRLVTKMRDPRRVQPIVPGRGRAGARLLLALLLVAACSDGPTVEQVQWTLDDRAAFKSFRATAGTERLEFARRVVHAASSAKHRNAGSQQTRAKAKRSRSAGPDRNSRRVLPARSLSRVHGWQGGRQRPTSRLSRPYL